LAIGKFIFKKIANRDPHSKAATLPETTHWARDIDKLIRIDGRRAEDVEAVILWRQNNGCFWGPNIQSGRKLREKFDQMWGQMQQQGNQRGHNPDLYVGQSDNAINPEDKQEKAVHDQWPPDQASIDFWNSVLAIVETKVSWQCFDTWFKPIQLCCLRDGMKCYAGECDGAVDLLKRIAEGTFGSDDFRLSACRTLVANNIWDSATPHRMWIRGKWNEPWIFYTVSCAYCRRIGERSHFLDSCLDNSL
jgi:hypothetical protein